MPIEQSLSLWTEVLFFVLDVRSHGTQVFESFLHDWSGEIAKVGEYLLDRAGGRKWQFDLAFLLPFGALMFLAVVHRIEV
jgi:hypothetical protein